TQAHHPGGEAPPPPGRRRGRGRRGAGGFRMTTTTEAATILVVDDDPDCREITARLLEREGHRTRRAASGEARTPSAHAAARGAAPPSSRPRAARLRQAPF